MTLDPDAGFLQRLLSQAKQVKPTLDAALNQFGALEHLEVARNGGLRGAELTAELTRAARIAAS